MRSSLTVVGGGIAGLVSSISAAEHGVSVDLHEAHSVLGGRARSTGPPFVANFGPHAVYCDSPFWAWLVDRGLVPATVRPLNHGARFRWRSRVRRLPPAAVVRAAGVLRGRDDVPVDLSFREWVAASHGDDAAAAWSAAAGVFAFTADPGALSAAFVQERLRRVTRLPSPARFVTGGWGSLVEMLAARARDLGVRIHLSSPVERLEPPVIVATSPAAARRLLDEPSLQGARTRVALLDVGVEKRRGDAYIVSDLDQAGWVERFSATDTTLAPAGHSLFQVQIGLRDGETSAQGVARAEQLLECAASGWREREVWRRRSVVDESTGALDRPGSTWHDRPPVRWGDGVWLAGDYVAAPGMLGEVAWASAVDAAREAAAALHAPTRTR